ncbi:GMC oxidoreductase [Membranihabitans maritimus]|uniref:GMC oxidoreductase n=1 Tax=Membranihabitans maritimus TaxID=2904244 RepID=UPI001F4059E7|nr:GMC family oxidoreductase [Membranihabitans maritimus]
MAINTFDAIVIGSGMTGGWAAKELTEKGLKTLVLERGREVKHLEDYPTTNMAPWEFKYRKYDDPKTRKEYPIQSKKYNFSEASKHFFVKDIDHPYSNPEDKPYLWFRGYQTGGKSLLWGRGSYRWSDVDFGANKRDGVGVDWPIRYKDIAPWYDYVEKFIGVSGSKEGIYDFPDGQFLQPLEMNCTEKEIKKRIESHYPDRKMIPNRVAHLTKVEPGQFKGRSQCQNRNLCHRGCPFGAYFSSNSSTLPAAHDTGNMTLRPHSIVESIFYDKDTNKVSGVRVIDAVTKEEMEFKAKVIFLCASTLPSTALLMRSTSDRFPDGLGNSSGVLGHYLMDHHKNVSGSGHFEGFEDKTYRGFRPSGVTIPRFRNIHKQETSYLRGFGIWGGASRGGLNFNQAGIGKELKEKIVQQGPWRFGLSAYGECLPYHDNKVELDYNNMDQWGLPTLRITAEFKENEFEMRKDMKAQIQELLEVAGLKDIRVSDATPIHGDAVHEMGTARMGRDPKTSMLNGYNQSHDIPNLFVTDGSAMPSCGHKSPSLTYMALTARACDYAVRKLKSGEI